MREVVGIGVPGGIPRSSSFTDVQSLTHPKVRYGLTPGPGRGEMITQSGNLYVIHGGVIVHYDGKTLTLRQDDRSIVTENPEFVAGVLSAAIRQRIPIESASQESD